MLCPNCLINHNEDVKICPKCKIILDFDERIRAQKALDMQPSVNAIIHFIFILTGFLCICINKILLSYFIRENFSFKPAVMLGTWLAEFLIWIIAYKICLNREKKFVLVFLGVLAVFLPLLTKPYFAWGIIGLMLFIAPQYKNKTSPSSNEENNTPPPELEEIRKEGDSNE